MPREARGLRACLRGSSWLSACPAGDELGRFPRAELRGSVWAGYRLRRRRADTGPPAPGSGQRDTAADSAAEREIPIFKRQLAAPIIKAEVKSFFWLWSLLFLPLIFFFFFAGSHRDTCSALGNAGHRLLDLKKKKKTNGARIFFKYIFPANNVNLIEGVGLHPRVICCPLANLNSVKSMEKPV